ncbi:uncharacterized protein TM35_000351160 [Trypanosoma theileri]|uniref:Uncharacterized protein n=1 Tax=Trypanosoma theileri TaxID=67003 RepID=A0A1X0NKS7_9TRYP|nr:uncharacterized protein TM35_000351160 [Trypanosoma theileri]ORC85372.1 hypothetical protein TM35_000351160 [Trypanosoma theileri]
MNVHVVPGGHAGASEPEVRGSDRTNTISNTKGQTPRRNQDKSVETPLSQPRVVYAEQRLNTEAYESSEAFAIAEELRRNTELRTRVRLRIASKKPAVKSSTGERSNDSEDVNDHSLVRSPRKEESQEMGNTRVTHHGRDDETRNVRKDEDKYEYRPLYIGGEDSKGGTSTEMSDDDEEVPVPYKLPSVEERLRLIRDERDRRWHKVQEKLATDNAKTVAPRPKTLTRVKYGGFKALPGRRETDSASSSSILAIGEGSLSEPQICEVHLEDGGSTTPSGAPSSVTVAPSKRESLYQQKQQQQQQQQQKMESNQNVKKDDLLHTKREVSPLVIEKDD